MKQKLLFLPYSLNTRCANDITEDAALAKLLADGWKIVQISATNFSYNQVPGLEKPCCYVLLEKED